jgi:pimeloyl-ACP methyl ester carboxylesterase
MLCRVTDGDPGQRFRWRSDEAVLAGKKYLVNRSVLLTILPPAWKSGMMSGSFAALDNEFALIPELASKAGIEQDSVPRVHRSWVNAPSGGHVSAVLWGTGPPEVIFLHEAGRSARSWDEVALRLGRPSVAIDLPGHGRSDWRRDRHYEPRTLAAAIGEAIGAIAPRAGLAVGSGLGGRTALALTTPRQPVFPPLLALIDTLPGTTEPGHEAVASTERFRSREEGVALLAARHPEWRESALQREADYELAQDPDGSWGWRHHVGHLPVAEGWHFDDVSLWEELIGMASPAFVIHGEHSGRLTPADLRDLERRAPQVQVITIPGVAEDVLASRPAALASRLNELLTPPEV